MNHVFRGIIIYMCMCKDTELTIIMYMCNAIILDHHLTTLDEKRLYELVSSISPRISLLYC